MRNEKIFNAMEHLEDKYIAEALEEYGSAKDIEHEEDGTDEPYIEAVLINAENNGGNKKGRFIKWAGLAAGVCAVTAGVIIMRKSGLFAGVGIPASSAATEAKTDKVIVSIIDRTKTEGLDYDTALEKFFEDEKYEYYFGGLYSRLIIVHYQDGSQEDIVTALNAGRATIADLDRFEVGYSYRSLGESVTSFTEDP